jgi:hypothetical protein
MDMDMDMDMGCRREAPQLDVPVRGGGEAEPRGGIECERARRERVRAPLRPLPLLPQAATSGRHQGSAAASPCIQESGEGAPLGPRGAALSKWMGLWSGRSPHGYGPLQARALALVTMLRPLIRLMSDGECSTQQPPSLCAAHEVMSACDGGSSMSHRHRLGAVSPTDWPTVATTTEVPTKHRSAPRLPWHCSLLKGRGTSVPLWKRHRQSEPAASMQPNCSPHGLNLSSAARLVAEGAISAV